MLLRCTVMDPQADPVGRAFTGPAVELALASYPGLHLTDAATAADALRRLPAGVRRSRGRSTHTVVHADGRTRGGRGPDRVRGRRPRPRCRPRRTQRPPTRSNRRVPLGTFVHARSGDKGGDAYVGLGVTHDGDSRRSTTLASPGWPGSSAPASPRAGAGGGRRRRRRLRAAAPGAVNVIIRGLLGQGVAASTRFDPQAKGLGEWVRSRVVHVQEDLL